MSYIPRIHGCVATYRTRANKGRSILEAAPLRDQAKTQLLCVFYVVI